MKQIILSTIGTMVFGGIKGTCDSFEKLSDIF